MNDLASAPWWSTSSAKRMPRCDFSKRSRQQYGVSLGAAEGRSGVPRRSLNRIETLH